MIISLQEETVTFFITFLSGILFGMLYDVFRILRIAIKHKNRTIFFEDILFFLVMAFATFMLALAKNRGEIRAYHLIGQTAGFLIYHLTIGEAVVFFADRIILFIRFIFHLINKFIIRPILKLLIFIFSIPFKVLRKIVRIFRKIFKKFGFSLKKRRVMLYNLKKEKKEEKKTKKNKEEENHHEKSKVKRQKKSARKHTKKAGRNAKNKK